MTQGATVLNVKDSPTRKALKELDKSKSIFLYCSNGKGSTKMTSSFNDWGFENVYTLEGGLEAWKKSENAVVQMN
ncbi:MAG: rhodanese-related sulfurtransferase [Limisphaerales bacterium]|jgi:rhodanese-related sulfurtransferase